jgi:hypothetical protein
MPAPILERFWPRLFSPNTPKVPSTVYCGCFRPKLMVYEIRTNNKHINTMAAPNDPNTPSTPTITQPPATLSPYIPTNEVVVMQTPLIRRSNSPFITPRALQQSQVIDVGNDPSFFLYSYGDNDNPVQYPMANTPNLFYS